MGVERWTDPAFVSRAHAWMRRVAERNGTPIHDPIERVHLRPWSTVFRARTARGAVFLKCCGASQAHEPRLTELLSRVRGRRVPALIARHPREDWMLMADGGKKLREVARGPTLLRDWEAVLQRYAELQIALLDRTPELLATRTPDHRLHRLCSDVATILDDRSVTTRPGADRLTRDDRRRIRASFPVIDAQCAELADVGIGPSIQHDDLHDGNLLRKGPRTVIFDWGDACISHPFLSLLVPLRAAAYRARTSPSDPKILRLRDAYLEPFARFAPAPRLRRAAAIGRRLGMVTRALSWHRVATLSDGDLATDSGTSEGWLRELPRAFPPSRVRA